jgi:hypothetical protein
VNSTGTSSTRSVPRSPPGLRGSVSSTASSKHVCMYLEHGPCTFQVLLNWSSIDDVIHHRLICNVRLLDRVILNVYIPLLPMCVQCCDSFACHVSLFAF